MFKAGDRVQNRTGNLVGTVLYTPLPQHDTVYDTVQVHWDDPNVVCHEQKARLVPVETEKAATEFLYKKGDRVRLKYNRNVGTVLEDQLAGHSTLKVHWDQTGKKIWEAVENILALHTPRERDEPHPMQAALDSIGEERERLKKQIEDLQFKLGGLTKAYKMIEEGW